MKNTFCSWQIQKTTIPLFYEMFFMKKHKAEMTWFLESSSVSVYFFFHYTVLSPEIALTHLACEKYLLCVKSC